LIVLLGSFAMNLVFFSIAHADLGVHPNFQNSSALNIQLAIIASIVVAIQFVVQIICFYFAFNTPRSRTVAAIACLLNGLLFVLTLLLL